MSPYLLGLLLLCPLTIIFALTPENQTVTIDDQTEINIEVYSQSPHTVLIWQPHELGQQAIDQQLANSLAQKGVATWLVGLLESNFLANTASNMDRLDANQVAKLITVATQTGNPVIVATSGRGAIPILRGVRRWQLANADNKQLAGVILLSPQLYVETPDPGVEAQFMPIVSASNVPLVILQPDKSPWYWKLNASIAALQSGGSEVFFQPLRGVRDRFYFRADANELEITQTPLLADKILNAAKLLANLPAHTRQAVRHIQAAPTISESKKERTLEKYQGDPQPPALHLPTLNGGAFDLSSLKGQVVLVNFWASWCPPCVYEMPSMQRLQDKMQGQPFTIVGVNMAEDPQTIRQFLTQKVSVQFPIVLDSDGKALKSWNVFAFPTSYVIDKQGKIRYALFGGVEWDNADIFEKILRLIKEPK